MAVVAQETNLCVGFQVLWSAKQGFYFCEIEYARATRFCPYQGT